MVGEDQAAGHGCGNAAPELQRQSCGLLRGGRIGMRTIDPLRDRAGVRKTEEEY